MHEYKFANAIWKAVAILSRRHCRVINLPVWDGSDSFNSSSLGQRDHYFADDIFKCISLNEKFYISIRIALKSVPRGLFEDNLTLVQVMAWRQTGDKILPEPVMIHFTSAYMQH